VVVVVVMMMMMMMMMMMISTLNCFSFKACRSGEWIFSQNLSLVPPHELLLPLRQPYPPSTRNLAPCMSCI